MPVSHWAETLKSIRNLLHAGRHAQERPYAPVDETKVHDARSMYVMICQVLDQAAIDIKAKLPSRPASRPA
jgi:hypothetical protein